MHYKVKKNTKIPYAIAIVAACLSVAFLYTGSFGIGNVMMQQIMMLVCATVAVYVLIRYVLTDHVYVISDSRPYTLEIVRVCGKNPKPMASFEMSGDDVLLSVQKGESLKKYGKIKRKENFCSNIFPRERYVYIVNTENGRVACYLEMEKDVAKILSDRINELHTNKNYQQNGETL